MKRARRAASRINRFYARWGALMQLVMGAFLVAVACVLTFVAISLYSYRSYGDHLVTLGCQRTREFGPPLAERYKRERVFTPRVQRDYETSIPEHC